MSGVRAAIPDEPSGSTTTNCTIPFNRLNPLAANKQPEQRMVSSATCTYTATPHEAEQCVAFTPAPASPRVHRAKLVETL